jgi:chromosome segregation ATPase
MNKLLVAAIEEVKTQIEDIRADRADLLLHITAMEDELDAINDTLDGAQHQLADLEADLSQAEEAADDEFDDFEIRDADNRGEFDGVDFGDA